MKESVGLNPGITEESFPGIETGLRSGVCGGHSMSETNDDGGESRPPARETDGGRLRRPETARALATEDGDPALATYSAGQNGVTFKLVPQVRASGETSWKILGFGSGVQGPIFTGERIDDEAADALGLDRALQDRLNQAARFAERNLELPRELRGESKRKRSLSDLERMADLDPPEPDRPDRGRRRR